MTEFEVMWLLPAMAVLVEALKFLVAALAAAAIMGLVEVRFT